MSLTEAELAAAGVAHLIALGHVVSEEVMLESSLRSQTRVGLGRADIVAQKGETITVLEAKLSLSWELFAQAKRWREYAHAVIMLVPGTIESDGRLLAFDVARRFGLGVWELGGDGRIVERVEPLIRESIDPELAQSIRPEHQNGRFAKAGQSGSANLYTPGNAAEAALATYVDRCGGCTLDEAVRSIKHTFQRHTSAVEYFAKKIRKGEIAGVYTGWRGRLFPTKESARTGLIT